MEIINNLSSLVAEDGAIFLSRKQGTGDELLAVFVDNPQAFQIFLEQTQMQPWPTVSLENRDSGQIDKVEFSARLEPLTKDDDEIRVFMTQETDFDYLLNKMIEIAERRSDEKGSERA